VRGGCGSGGEGDSNVEVRGRARKTLRIQVSSYDRSRHTSKQSDTEIDSRERIVIEITIRIEHNGVQDHVDERLHHPVSYRTTNRSESRSACTSYRTDHETADHDELGD
jgi:hypothetical protein